MKKAIRFTAFMFWIFFLFVNTFFVPVQAQAILHSVLKEWTLYSAQNEVITDLTKKKGIFVFRSYRSCSECFRSIDQLAVQLKDSTSAKWYGVGFSDSLNLERKRELATIRSMMPDLMDYFVYYHNPAFLPITDNESRMLISPCILLVNSTNVEFIPYSNLFYTGTATVDLRLIEHLKTFFK